MGRRENREWEDGITENRDGRTGNGKMGEPGMEYPRIGMGEPGMVRWENWEWEDGRTGNGDGRTGNADGRTGNGRTGNARTGRWENREMGEPGTGMGEPGTGDPKDGRTGEGA